MTFSTLPENAPIRTFARIDLDAVLHNFRALKSLLPEKTLCLAAVKANAYGHGAIPTARALEGEVDYFAVACVEEAMELREGGIEKPILILTYTDPAYYETLIQNRITATLYSVDQAALLSQKACDLNLPACVHIAVDTGMGRIGFFPNVEGADAVKQISQMKGLSLEGIFSHYALADAQDKTDAKRQEALFDRFLEMLKVRGVEFPIRHICNSAASMEMKKKYDMCRFGISLYGYFPSDEVSRETVTLRPAMEVITHVIHTKTVPKGFQIGYGHTYTAPEEKQIATLSIGYADGFRRALSGKGYVLIHGQKAPVVGRVCMDQVMVDISKIEDVKVGDEAVVLGKSGEEEISAGTMGALCHSFSHEVLCSFSPRVKRVYLPVSGK